MTLQPVSRSRPPARKEPCPTTASRRRWADERSSRSQSSRTSCTPGSARCSTPAPWPSIRRQGGRRRTARRALTAVGTAGIVAVVGLTLGDRPRPTMSAPTTTRPSPTTPVSRRPPRSSAPSRSAPCDEIPGAVQVSDWQVVLPCARRQERDCWSGEKPVDRQVVGDPVPLDAKSYQGVTIFPAPGLAGVALPGHARLRADPEGTEDEQLPRRLRWAPGSWWRSGAAELACVSYEGRTVCARPMMTRAVRRRAALRLGDGHRRLPDPGFRHGGLPRPRTTAPERRARSPFAGLPGTDVARVGVRDDLRARSSSGQRAPGARRRRLDDVRPSAGRGGQGGRLRRRSGDVIEDHPLAPVRHPGGVRGALTPRRGYWSNRPTWSKVGR